MIGSAIRLFLGAALAIALAWAPAQAGGVGGPVGAIAMHGEPALPPDFDHLPYVNPQAPKGGRLDLAYLGAFDSLNPYNVKALSTAQGLIGNVYQSLMARSADEPFTLYGLIARSIETDPARDHVVFHLDPDRPVLGRNADHLGRCRVHLQSAQGQGPPAAAGRLFAGQKHRRARPMDRAIRSFRRQ